MVGNNVCLKKLRIIIYLGLIGLILMGCSVRQEMVQKTKVEKIKALGKAEIIEEAVKIVGNKIDVHKFEHVEVRSSKKNIYVNFYNSIAYLPLDKTYTVSVVVDMLAKYSWLNTFSNLNGKEVSYFPKDNHDLKVKQVNSAEELQLISRLINNAIEGEKKRLNSYPTNTLKLLSISNSFEGMPTVLETKKSYHVSIVTDVYDLFYTVSKDKGLVENFVLGSIAPDTMRDESKVEFFEIMK